MTHVSRREVLRMLSLLSATSVSGWFPRFASAASDELSTNRSCILLWMPGGPSQLDTFDLKPGHANGGEFRPISTAVPGIEISEHLPKLAAQAGRLAIVRSMKTKEGDHSRAAFHLRTGYRPTGPLQYPTLGSLVSHEREQNRSGLPNYVSILGDSVVNPGAFGPGFLGPRHAPLLVGGGNRNPENSEYGAPLEIQNIRRPAEISATQADTRLSLLEFVETEFADVRPSLPVASHQTAYRQAVRMMNSQAMRAFNLDEEPASLRDAYGRNRFGQACLLARRLVEQGIPFIEIALGGPDGNTGIGWDTHIDNFNAVRNLSATLDAGWGTLLADLQDRGLLDTTTILWMGEFGRTPTINPNGGRDHFPNAWSVVLAGGGIRGGQIYGATNESGMDVADRPVAVNQLLATLLAALGIDHTRQNMSSIGRPIRLVEPETEPIAELLL